MTTILPSGTREDASGGDRAQRRARARSRHSLVLNRARRKHEWRQQGDADTKLVRFGARDYDPGMGRWTNKDPIGFAGQQGNLYVYVDGEPVNVGDPTGLEPNSKQCMDLLKRIRNIKADIDKRIGELDEDKLNLPETTPNDSLHPWESRREHRRILNESKENLARRQAEYLSKCGPPPSAVAPSRSWLDWEYWKEVTGLTGAALIAYLIVSEGSRLFPPRNLVPVP